MKIVEASKFLFRAFSISQTISGVIRVDLNISKVHFVNYKHHPPHSSEPLQES
jgi:hypothetical protein